MCFWTFSKHLKQIHVRVCRRIYLIFGCFSVAKCRVNIPYIDAMDPSQSATLKSKYMANRPKKGRFFSRAQCSTNTSGRSRWAMYFSSSQPPETTNMTGWRIHHFEDVFFYWKMLDFPAIVMLVNSGGSGVSFLHPTSSWPIHWRWRRFAKKRWLRHEFRLRRLGGTFLGFRRRHRWMGFSRIQPRKKKKTGGPGYFPWNTGCLLGIRIYNGLW